MANNNSPDSDIYRNCFAIILQNPSCDGKWIDYSNLIAHLKNINPQLLVIMVCDLLSLVLFKSPAAMGADIAVGSSQRFGVSLGFGGPSAAYIATHECHKRLLPGRIIGVTKDSHGKSALRMSLQTREQHIRRHKATSNICTSQVLLANMAAFYAIYHGKSGLVNIAKRIQKLALYLMAAIDMQMQSQASPAITVSNYSHHAQNDIQNDTHKNPHNATHAIFDTVIIHFAKQNVRDDVYQQLLHNGYLVGLGEFINMPNALCISIGERATKDEVINIASIICAIANYQDGGSNNSTVNNSNAVGGNKQSCEHAQDNKALTLCEAIIDTYRHSDYYRQDEILTHAVFNSYHSETKLMRYLKRLENRDISLVHSMIPLGSCTMKLNAATELEGLSWSQFANIHPYSPALATMGYRRLIDDLSSYLMQITGFSAISMQPNSGAQGEYAGLLAIRRYQKHLQQDHVRDVCLIPQSAHGTNPASASLMGLKVVAVACDGFGNVDIEDLRKKAILHQKELCCFMITYPSTHGVFEAGIKTMCSIIHENGGMVYMDGANLNALVGLVKIADLGADVAHMNLHKTFAIPHGGGGPGMGPIGVIDKLAPFLPSHVTKKIIYGSATNNSNTNNGTTSNNITNDNTNVSAHASHAVSSSPFGSASILLISWMYINLLGLKGLKRSTQTAILSANYIAKRLAAFYPILYSGKNGMVAHECIIDLRPLKEKSTITELDVAKRLMDYGFHAPTMSFPVAGTLMIEPTESEDKAELDRFIAALISIHKEILQVISGEYDITNNPLKNAPHTMADILAWNKPYSIKTGCFPGDWQTTDKIFPSVNRLDDAYGDRQLICSCSGMLKE